MSTYVILLWVPGTYEGNDSPTAILGPFTKADAEQVASFLTCEHRLQQINTEVPEWAS